MTRAQDFQYFNDELLNMGAICSAAELQGMLCGKLCGSGRSDETLPSAWENDIKRLMDMTYLEWTTKESSLVAGLFELTLTQLEDVTFSFRPLLPLDSASLSRRTEELANWCRGFLHGLGTSGLKGSDQLDADVADALRDLAKIAQADEAIAEADAEQENEQMEADWEELVEYVKVAVLNIREALRPSESRGETAH